MIEKKLDRNEMIFIVENIFYPIGKGLTAEDMEHQLVGFCLNCPADRKFKRGFGAMVREVIFCTGARSVTKANILPPTVADLCVWVSFSNGSMPSIFGK